MLIYISSAAHEDIRSLSFSEVKQDIGIRVVVVVLNTSLLLTNVFYLFFKSVTCVTIYCTCLKRCGYAY